MKHIIPNLFIDNCKENLEYYRQIFGGEIRNIVPRFEQEEKIMHGELHINESCVLYFGDKLEEAPATPNIHIFLKLSTEEEIQRIYDALMAEGDAEKELDESFWGTLHAVVIDKNGIIWDLDN